MYSQSIVYVVVVVVDFAIRRPPIVLMLVMPLSRRVSMLARS
jgi:hypothetical protein